MCGRFSQTLSLEELLKRFMAEAPELLELKPRYNIAPTQPAPVVVEEGGRKLRLYRWGLIPSWAKDSKIGAKMINARAETLLKKPSFKRPFERQRCLVPADGFYEWKPEPGGKLKTPMRIALKSRRPFAMAGLWDRWAGAEGEPIFSFAVITTTAAPSLKAIHERMPAILREEDQAQWLDPRCETRRLTRLLGPVPDEDLEAYPVSPLLNSAKIDDPALLRRVPALQEQLSLLA